MRLKLVKNQKMIIMDKAEAKSAEELADETFETLPCSNINCGIQGLGARKIQKAMELYAAKAVERYKDEVKAKIGRSSDARGVIDSMIWKDSVIDILDTTGTNEKKQ